MKRDFAKAGFVFDAESRVLAHPDDDHTKLVFDDAIRGKTDQFVYRFKRKTAPGRRTDAKRTGDVLRLAMWSGPRNVSTAFMRSWGNREDTVVVDEPFYAHYLQVTGLDHPGRDEVIASQPTDWREVAAMLHGAGARAARASITRSRWRITCCPTWGASGSMDSRTRS